jgi:2OG-Fe(II) oxygenase superfamily
MVQKNFYEPQTSEDMGGDTPVNPNIPLIGERPLSFYPNIMNHPNLEIIEDYIWVIHDFTTPEEREKYISYGESKSEDEWHAHNNEWWVGKFLPIDYEYASTFIPGIVERFAKLIENDQQEFTIGEPGSLHRQREGHYLYDHADNPRHEEGTPHLDNHVLTSFVLYHSDFDGGEIYYYHLGHEYKPRAGDLVIHPGTERFRHGTRPVKGDRIRYNSTIWAYDNKVKHLHDQGLVFENDDTINPLQEALYKMGEEAFGVDFVADRIAEKLKKEEI